MQDEVTLILALTASQESQNPTMVWVEKDLEDHFLPAPLSAGASVSAQGRCGETFLCLQWSEVLSITGPAFHRSSDTHPEMPNSGCPHLPGESHL